MAGLAVSSLGALLAGQATTRPEAPAILAPGRAALSFAALAERAELVRRALRAAGLGRDARVAVVMPNGAEMVVAVLAIAAHAVAVPINRAYGAAEFTEVLAALGARALVTQPGSDPAATAAARALGLVLLEIAPLPEAPAGCFGLAGEAVPAPPDPEAAPERLALIFLTSGTTAKPKFVRLTEANLCTAAAACGTALALGPADRSINMMPLFHGHGLVCVVLAALAAGGSVVCTAGLEASAFFDWLTTFRPSWYSAVPTQHQAILAEARRRGMTTAPVPLRLIRCASAAMPPSVVDALEALFATCVIDTYAMTETAGAPVACQPLPPGERRRGSVGKPAGLDVAIRDGEVVVRGAAVMQGYDGDAALNDAAFVEGWFRTGDLGQFDADGYLFLTGRAKELINRGGEKIAPREIDEALLEHPAVAEAVAFPVPHPTLGEDVAAAVVLHRGESAAPEALRAFLAARLAAFKLPQRILLVERIPKGATGKVMRAGLAAVLVPAEPAYTAPRTPLEAAIAAGWQELLACARIGIDDNFFSLGGDSLSGVRALAQLAELTGRDYDAADFLAAPTIAGITARLAAAAEAPRRGIPRLAADAATPASPGQARFWRLQQVLPGIPIATVVHALRLTGACDPAILARCLAELVRRHAALRTTLVATAAGCMQHVSATAALPLPCDDLLALPPAARETAGARILQAEALHEFDLARGPLLRARLLRLAAAEHLLFLTAHHAIIDGWSFGLLAEELAALYPAFAAGQASPLPPPALAFTDVAAWQHGWQVEPSLAAQRDFWREQLAPPLAPLALPLARPRLPTDGLNTTRHRLLLPPALATAARRLAQAEGTTLFSVLATALMLLLRHRFGGADQRLASLVANRGRPGTERLIGPLANTVVLRARLEGNLSGRAALRQVAATAVAALAHQELPFETVLEMLATEHGVRPDSLAQVMLVLQNASLRPERRGPAALQIEEALPELLAPIARASSYDLTFIVHERPEGLALTGLAKAGLFPAGFAEALLEGFAASLEQLTEEPERLILAMSAPGDALTSRSRLEA